MVKEGTIGNLKEGKADGICRYLLKAYDEPSEYGINGGKITKLLIERNGVATCNYDRGWSIKPQDELSNMALCILLNEYN